MHMFINLQLHVLPGRNCNLGYGVLSVYEWKSRFVGGEKRNADQKLYHDDPESQHRFARSGSAFRVGTVFQLIPLVVGLLEDVKLFVYFFFSMGSCREQVPLRLRYLTAELRRSAIAAESHHPAHKKCSSLLVCTRGGRTLPPSDCVAAPLSPSLLRLNFLCF